MGLERKGGPATLGPLPGIQTPLEIFFAARVGDKGLDAERTFIHALERILLGARPSSADNQWREFRGLLLHLLQPSFGRNRGNILSRQEREVSCSIFAHGCANANTE
jgi:hypothetical protein